jgi:hypothetical protein
VSSASLLVELLNVEHPADPPYSSRWTLDRNAIPTRYVGLGPDCPPELLNKKPSLIKIGRPPGRRTFGDEIK